MPFPDCSGMRMACLNKDLLEDWGLSAKITDGDDVARWMNSAPHPFAMAYAGHQYGYFTMLGDGRAMLLGEWQNESGHCYDIHLKGSGPTPFARGGDGHATLRYMLREFLISEALYGLGVPTTRSLMVLETPYKVWRDVDQRGGVLFRMAPHHVRIGTLEYAIRALAPEEYARFAGAVLERTTLWWSKQGNVDQGFSLYRLGKPHPEAVLAFFEEWTRRQAELVAQWMRVGFVHGVLNTDNISLLGITMDFGPCAFVNTYDLNQSFSSIDSHGRYAWGRQGDIMAWNAEVLLSCLLPLLDGDHDNQRAMQIATDMLQRFRTLCDKAMERMQWMKLGLDPDQAHGNVKVHSLVADWQAWLSTTRPDYTQAYLNLEQVLAQFRSRSLDGDEVLGQGGESLYDLQEKNFPSKLWMMEWLKAVEHSAESGFLAALERMHRNNPAVFPRNHRVEEALDQKVLQGCDDLWDELIQAFCNPYERNARNRELNQPPSQEDAGYCTFCGT